MAQARTVDWAHRSTVGAGYGVRMDISPTAGTDRPNTNLAIAVDEAIGVNLELGKRVAAAYLMARGAHFALTCRVLGEPERRRRSYILNGTVTTHC